MEFLAVVGVILVAFILFCVYFIFKQIQFVLVSVNLYKKMVNRQDAMIKLLLDIRDNTKKYDSAIIATKRIEETQTTENNSALANESEEEPPDFCFHCGAENPKRSKVCPKCGKQL